MTWNAGAGLAGKGIVVTGAAGAIGSEVAGAFASAGAHVLAVDINEEGLAALVPSLAGGPHGSQATDLRDLPSHEPLLRRAIAEFGRVDVLANIAGVLIRRGVTSTRSLKRTGTTSTT